MRLPSSLGRTPVRIGILIVAAVVAIAGAAYAALPGTAKPRLSGSPEFVSTMVAGHSAQCLTVPPHTRGAVTQQACTEEDGQRFAFVKVGDFYQISSVATGSCLDVHRAREREGTPLVQTPDCHGGPNQQFSLRAVDQPADSYLLVARHSGGCLDVAAGSQEEGAAVQQWSCGDPATAGNQVWRIERSLRTAAPATYGPVTGESPSPSPSAEPSAEAPARGSGNQGGGPQAIGTNPDWGKAAPPTSAPRSRAYQMILSDDKRGYHPRSGECSREIHARYWVYGPDGKVYPTWHPPRHSSGCSFGHEHGDDPRTSKLFAKHGWPPFGYANEQLAPSAPASQRDEDHVGHKVQVGNDRRVIEGDDGRAQEPPSGRVTMVCDSLIKFHQGTHSPDAFTNNLHELLYNVRCSYQDNGHVIETRFWALPPIGTPGGFTRQECAGASEHLHVGTANPADSPDGGFPGLGRRIPDEKCAAAVLAGQQDMFAMHENWFANVFHRSRPGSDANQLRNFQILGYFLVLDPARYFDPNLPNKMGNHIDLCYQGAEGFQCEQVRRLSDRNGGQQIAWDDPRSPFRGANRLFAPGTFIVQNEGPTTIYTDAYGVRFSTSPFPGSIEQYISGNRASDRNQGFIRGTFTNYAADPADGVHAPN